MKRTEYSASTKAAAMAALMAGQSIGSVAKEYKLPAETVKTWKRRIKGSPLTPNGSHVEPSKRTEIGSLLVDYLHTNLATLKAQAAVFADPEWLRKQDAGELAVLHGVMTDKAIRLLEALGGAGNG